MKSNGWHRRLTWCVLACLLALPAEAARLALLVGVSTYGHPDVPHLEGPRHDVSALRNALVARWGFNPADIEERLDARAGSTQILESLERLIQRAGPGDEVLIYFSGHGTSALDRGAAEIPLPYGSGAFVAHDFDPTQPQGPGLIVGRRDLLPRLLRLEQRASRVWVVMDSCYSGQAVRQSMPTAADPNAWPERTFRISRPNTPQRLAALPAQRPAPPPYPYSATAFLAAAAEGETAKDLSGAKLKFWPTVDGLPHGAFTDALLRVLNGQLAGDLNADGLLDLHEVHRAVDDVMARRPYGQTPQRLPAVADDANALGARPVLGARGVAATPRAAEPRPLRVRTEGLPTELRRRLQALPGVEITQALQADLTLASTDGRQVSVIDAAGDRLLQASASDVERLTGQVRQRAWAARLHALATRHARGVLPVGIVPNDTGGDLFVGEQVSFMLRPPLSGWLVLINLDSQGQLTPLYPMGLHDTLPLPAGVLWQTPQQKIVPPEGKDLQFMLLFDREPVELAAWTRLSTPRDAADRERLEAMLERMLTGQSLRYLLGHTEFRTWNRPR